MTKVPKKIFALFGEFMHEFNYLDYQCKLLLVDLIEDRRIGHFLIMHQHFEFVLKRVDKVFELIVEKPTLLKRWKECLPKLKKYQELRNDIAHSHCDINPDKKSEFILTRFTEKQALQLTHKAEFYDTKELFNAISELKRINIKLKHLFHSTFVQQTGAIFVRKKPIQ